MKVCTKCQKSKPLSDYYLDKRRGKPRARCKTCIDEDNRLYENKNAEATTAYRQKYYQKNKPHINELNNKNYRLKPNDYSERAKINYVKNKREYQLRNHKNYIINLESITTRHTVYAKWYLNTPSGKICIIKSKSKSRGLGYTPLNNWFEGSEFHHMFINNDVNIGIHIPKKLHRSVKHNPANEFSMTKINTLAMNWIISDCTRQAASIKSILEMTT